MNTLSEITQLPTITLASLLLVFVVGVIFHATYDEKTADFGPTILTTTGIFFTFLGIAIGLKEFDVSNVQASVPGAIRRFENCFLGVGRGCRRRTHVESTPLCIRVACQEGWRIGDGCNR